MNNLRIIGTTHLMGREQIIREIQDFNPDIIGVELCETRLNLMVKNPISENNSQEDTSLIGKITSAIKKKAEEQKIVYGSDMITASRYALDKGIPLVCLDKDINEIRVLMEKIPSAEQIGFMQELSKFEETTLTKEVDENKVLKELKEKYPISFEFLINSRDLEIEKNILKTLIKNPHKKILCFIGRGHLNKIDKEING